MNDEFIKEYMLSSYILVLSTKRLRRDLNPCYSCVTGRCHNQLGDGAKTRWICLQFNIPNITHYLYCCIHLNGGGRTRTYGVSLWLIYSQLPSPLDYSPASLLSRTAILKEDDTSWSLNNLTPDDYYIHQSSKITSSFIVLLSNAKLFSYEVLRIYLFVTIHLSEGFMPFTNKYSLCTLGCRLLYPLNGQNVTEAIGATNACQLIPINGFEPLTFPV